MNNNNKNLTWTSTSKYVDIDTGEQLNKDDVTKNYIIIKKTKHVQTNQRFGTIEYITECRKRIQPTSNQCSLF